ncbi:MAG: glycosyltransferase family 2 protein [Chitinophagales bacterium]|nr:glycosyltransferase family 2 protein [Chitinophagales bacterium]
MKVSIVAPMYNEEKNLENTYKQVSQELENNGIEDYEIIFVNDGSTDATWEKAKQLAARVKNLNVIGYEQNQGRGKALRTGFDFATGDVIVSIDFDLSYDTSHISRMLDELNRNSSIDVVLTSCYMPGGKTVGVPAFRLFISKTANLLYRFAFTPQIYTTTCVVRAYRKHAIKSLDLESNDKEIHLEIISKLLANNFRIKEIPGTLTKRQAGKSNFKFTAHSISHILFFIQERPFVLFGIIGLLLIFAGFGAAIILFITRFGDVPGFKQTFISRISSPNFVIIIFLAAFQILGLGFLGIQNNMLKKELFRMQRNIKGLGK